MKEFLINNWFKVAVITLWILTITVFATGFEVHIDGDNSEGFFEDPSSNIFEATPPPVEIGS